ncbi:MAG: hypothetical protein ACJ758_03600 [Actinomycetota bacterium]
MRKSHKRFAVVFTAAALVAVLGATMALAGEQTNGNGKTSSGFTLGFNAKADLTGSFEYQPTDVNGTSYNIHCNDYTRYVQTTTPNGLYPKSIVNSTFCTDANGVRYYVHAEFVDRGEPGTRDSACITVKLYPGRTNAVLIKDCGTIQNGNIQIHPTNSPADAEMVATPTA